MEIVAEKHGLRTITLAYDRSVEAPDFEIRALALYREMHDRALARKVQVNALRREVEKYRIGIEEARHAFERLGERYGRLQQTDVEHPYYATLYQQVNQQVDALNRAQLRVVQPLIEALQAFDVFDEASYLDTAWQIEEGFPACSEVIRRSAECSVDMVFFDEDLKDFRRELDFVSSQELAYSGAMQELDESYEILNDEIADLLDEIAGYDEALLETLAVRSGELEAL